MSARERELRQKRYGLVQKMNEITKRGTWTDAENTEWRNMRDEVDKLAKQIETGELVSEMREFNVPPGSQLDNGERRVNTTELVRRMRAATTYRERTRLDIEIRSSQEYRDDFGEYARTGQISQLLNEFRVQGAELRYTPLDNVTGANGEFLIPVGFQKELEIKLKAFGGMRRNARVITTASGNTLQWPTMDDTTNTGAWLAVNAAVPQQNPAFGQVPFTSNLATSQQVLVPVQLLQDSAFDVEEVLSDAFAIRLGRVTNLAYTLGTGAGQPSGLIPAITNIVVPAGGSVNSGNVGDTYAVSIGTPDLDNLIAALDPAYRPGAKFMANQKTYDTLRKLLDKYGHPIWQASLASKEPDTLVGYPYDWNQDMATIALSAKTVVFGNFTKYVIRDVLGITMVRYNELYMPNHQVGFQAYLRTDGQCIQPAAFAILQTPAS